MVDQQLNYDTTFSPLFDAMADQALVLDVHDLSSGATDKATEAVIRALRGLDALVFCDIGMEPAGHYLSLQRFAPTQVRQFKPINR